MTSAVSVVTTGPPGRAPRFPDIVRRQGDGELLAVYHLASAHVGANGRVMIVRSTDNGRTWSAPADALPGIFVEGDLRDPKLTALADGGVLLAFFVLRWDLRPHPAPRGVWVARLAPGQAAFSRPAQVCEHYEHGPAVELADGVLLQPVYTARPSAALAYRSRDGGTTWTAHQAVAPRDGLDFLEPNITALPGGELVLLARTEADGVAQPSRLVRSHDGGRTWGEPEVIEQPTSSHHQLLTSDGRVLVTYGRFVHGSVPHFAAPGARRPTRGFLVEDPAGPWRGYPEAEVYDAGAGVDQANPSSVEVTPGVFSTLGFDVSTRRLVAARTEAAQYRA